MGEIMAKQVNPLKNISVTTKHSSIRRQKSKHEARKILGFGSGKRRADVLSKTQALVTANSQIDAKKFDSLFHRAHVKQDEMMSTSLTLDTADHLRSKGHVEAAKDLIEISHYLRVPTAWMGHHVKRKDGFESVMQHPTSKNTEIYAPSGRNHGTFNLERDKHANSVNEAMDAPRHAVAFSMNNGMQPPFAKNSLSNASQHVDAKAAHNHREDLKDWVRGGRPQHTVRAANDSWEPGKFQGRDVSPPRQRK
jgi:soluble cytochrome b562